MTGIESIVRSRSECKNSYKNYKLIWTSMSFFEHKFHENIIGCFWALKLDRYTAKVKNVRPTQSENSFLATCSWWVDLRHKIYFYKEKKLRTESAAADRREGRWWNVGERFIASKLLFNPRFWCSEHDWAFAFAFAHFYLPTSASLLCPGLANRREKSPGNMTGSLWQWESEFVAVRKEIDGGQIGNLYI